MNTSDQPPTAAAGVRRLEAFPPGETPPPGRGEPPVWPAVCEVVDEPVLALDAKDGRILAANGAACRFFGQEPGALRRQRLADLGAGEPAIESDLILQSIARARARGPQSFDWRGSAGDGGLRSMPATLCAAHEGCAYLVLHGPHQGPGGRTDANRDEERFRLLIGRAPILAVQGLGADGLVHYWNEASERLYGYSAAEALGRPLLSLIVPDSIQPEMRIALHQMAMTGRSLPPAEVRLRRKDGRPVSVLSSAVVLQPPGAAPEIYRLDFDLSEREQAEAERLALERRLLHTQNLETIGALAGGVAHDFNNLLTGVLGNLELAAGELEPESATRPLLDDAIAATRLAGSLTQQLLAYAGHARPQHRSVDLNTIVEEHAAVLAVATAGRATLQLDLAKNLPAAEADPAHVAQILINLVTNAAEAITSGGTVEVRTGFVEECPAERLAESRLLEKPAPQPFVFLEVADTGCGMSAAMAKRVFDPFFSTKFTGRGLGLPVVFGIVRAHRGALFIDSQPGRGCVVRVLLPLARIPSAGPPEPVEEGGLSGTLLVVDDEESIRRIAQRMGHRLGIDVLTAIDADSAGAIARLHAGAISCALVDYMMPAINGVDCLRMLREVQPGLPAVLCSGCLPPELADHAATGFDAVLPKPFSIEQFAEALRAATRRTMPATE